MARGDKKKIGGQQELDMFLRGWEKFTKSSATKIKGEFHSKKHKLCIAVTNSDKEEKIKGHTWGHNLSDLTINLSPTVFLREIVSERQEVENYRKFDVNKVALFTNENWGMVT